MDASRTTANPAECADDASSVYSDDTGSSLGDLDMTWVRDLEEFSEFYPDFPTTLRTRVILRNSAHAPDASGAADPVWARDERLVVDNNGVLSNGSLIRQLDGVLSSLRAQTRQSIEVEDIRLFECVVSEADMERFVATREHMDGFSDTICRQREVRYMKDDIQLRQGISFFHLLNTLIIILRMKPGDGEGRRLVRTRKAGANAGTGARRGTRKLR